MKNIIKTLGNKKRLEIATLAEQIYQIGFADGQASTVEDTTVQTIKLTNVDELQVGDKVKFIGQKQDFNNDVTNGKLYTIERFHSGTPTFKDDVTTSYIHQEHIHLFERVVESDYIAPSTANQQRAKLIQWAKEFVEKFQAVRNGDKTHDEGNTTALEHWYETDFFVKERKVTAVVYHLEWGVKRVKRSSHVGRAFCAPGDVFNADIGKAIALARALEIDIPQEFLNAVQPNEFVIGQVVNVVELNSGEVHVEGELIGVESQSVLNFPEKVYKDYFGHAYSRTTLDPYYAGAIIDDTNAEYANES